VTEDYFSQNVFLGFKIIKLHKKTFYSRANFHKFPNQSLFLDLQASRKAEVAPGDVMRTQSNALSEWMKDDMKKRINEK